MRSHGRVRFVTLTTRMQAVAAGITASVILACGFSMGAMAISQYNAQAERAALLDRAANVASAEERVTAYRNDLGEVTEDLQRRQAFLEEMIDMLPADMREDPAAETVSEDTADTVAKVSAALPEAAGLARLEARQLALVHGLTRFAESRAERAEAAIRELGLNPAAMLRASETAMGGPLRKLATDRDGSVDPRFERLGASLARMDALERGLSGIPQFMPADISMISSGFGYRRDPFTGSPAVHSGLDFRGPVGAPIHAAAQGRVTFVGTRSGYGKVVEITHGNGLMTRYAHMSAWRAKAGQTVDAGDVIGAIGSTGRSTGPHLHFEVHVNGRAVNPRPFLESAPHVLEEVRSGPDGNGAARG